MIRKIVLALTFVVITGCGLVVYVLSDDIPQHQSNHRAEQLIDRMWDALNAQAWFNAQGVQWSFRNKHHYVWHKTLGRVRATFDDYVVYFEPHSGEGVVLEKGKVIYEATEKESLLTKAIQYFNNDSFWLLAPFKARDQGTLRHYVPHTVDQDGKDSEGVLVHYQSGGSTPGDRYLWIFDQDGKPKSWKLWVEIVPVKGMSFTWEQWKETTSGAKVAQLHQSTILNVSVSHIKIVNQFKDLGVTDQYLSDRSNIWKP